MLSANEITSNVVIAHYNENLNWLHELENVHQSFTVYSKTDRMYNYIPENKGNEALPYLKYIIDNYDNLATMTLFMHGHDNSYHQEFPSAHLVKNINWNCNIEYFNVVRRDWYNIINQTHYTNEYKRLKDNWVEIFGHNIPFITSIEHYACAQFAVHKQLILSNTIEFYKNCYEFLLNTTLSNYISGRLFEYTWHYIFTKNPIEPKYDYKDFMNI